MSVSAEEINMDTFLRQMADEHSESMQTALTEIMCRQNTVESQECVNWLSTAKRKPLWQLAVVAMLVNDGLIMYDNTAGSNTDAEHVVLEPGLAELIRNTPDPKPSAVAVSSGEMQTPESDEGAFERELAMLSVT